MLEKMDSFYKKLVSHIAVINLTNKNRRKYNLIGLSNAVHHSFLVKSQFRCCEKNYLDLLDLDIIPVFTDSWVDRQAKQIVEAKQNIRLKLVRRRERGQPLILHPKLLETSV